MLIIKLLQTEFGYFLIITLLYSTFGYLFIITLLQSGFGYLLSITSLYSAIHLDPTASTYSRGIVNSIYDLSVLSCLGQRSLFQMVVDSAHSMAQLHLPYLRHAYTILSSNGSTEKQLQKLIELDQSLDASMRCNHVARRASTAQGSSMLMLMTKSNLSSDSTTSTTTDQIIIVEYKRLVRLHDTAGHYTIAFALSYHRLGLSLGTTSILICKESLYYLISDEFSFKDGERNLFIFLIVE
jgi:hypothetical protein